MADSEELRGQKLYEALMALKPAGLAETDWAVKSGINRGFFTNLKGSTIAPRSDNLRKLLQSIQKSHEDLYRAAKTTKGATAKEPDLPPVHHVSEGETVEIIQLDLSLSMGPGTIIDDWVESTAVTFDLNFIRGITRSSPGRLRLVTGIGRSMEPTLQDGDVILVDTTERMLSRHDGIYWVSIYGSAGIKRLRAISPSRILIISDNKEIDPQEIEAEDLRIEGRAIWAARGL